MNPSAQPIHPPLKDSRLIDVLRLIRSENVGPVTFFHLMRRYGTAEKALAAIPNLAARGGAKRQITVCPKSVAETEIEKTELYGAQFICYGDEHYPPLLMQIVDAPPVLIALGHTHLLAGIQTVGMVGARNASANGCNFARKLAGDLGKAGCTVVSGLARGIDAQAHKGALATGTVGVIAGGIDTQYPPENGDLYKEMREQGCILTEQPLGMAPHSRSFPSRNRIIAGISRGVVVIEASKKSGSLITAQDALEYNREVFAVPGSPMDPRCHGTNALIKDGATLTEGVDDVLRGLHRIAPLNVRERQFSLFDEAAAEPFEDEKALASARERITELLGPTPVSIDDLIEQSALPANLILTILLEKELAGMVQRHAGGKVSVVVPSA